MKGGRRTRRGLQYRSVSFRAISAIRQSRIPGNAAPLQESAHY
ncbi:hypothetical protein HMPREF0731_2474 [Pseudoroseomonas cervicalis ATCC 49957]|uniref:Uncharacterized protein n=1 Tax=Pseudoroseomonas cervicalis ATCC 49957 TaxID=525371 RepID=D5RN13_9PROT|nr:hypothetical protein HMPREF0731_2474 [Pseudoroseomonas cervicalis ATCC 49957]